MAEILAEWRVIEIEGVARRRRCGLCPACKTWVPMVGDVLPQHYAGSASLGQVCYGPRGKPHNVVKHKDVEAAKVTGGAPQQSLGLAVKVESGGVRFYIVEQTHRRGLFGRACTPDNVGLFQASNGIMLCSVHSPDYSARRGQGVFYVRGDATGCDKDSVLVDDHAMAWRIVAAVREFNHVLGGTGSISIVETAPF